MMIVIRREPAHRRKNRQRVKQQQKQVRQNVIMTMILRIIMMAILMMTMIKMSIQHNALAPPYEFDDAEITALQQEGGMERSMIEVGMMR